MKICTYNVKFGLFLVCSVTLRQFVWILVKGGWLLCISICICNSCGVIWTRSLWMRGWRNFLVAKLCKFWEILKPLHLVSMLWKWHHCWMMRSVWKSWPYMHDLVHKPMGIYLVVWYLKWISQICQKFYCWVSKLAIYSPNPHRCLENFPFKDHLNQTDSSGSIRFPNESEQDNSYPFCDTKMVKKAGGGVKLLACRKNVHTGQYLNPVA